MKSFDGALRAINEMKQERVIEDYAVFGAMAAIFWTEAAATYDLDVLVNLGRQDGLLVSLDGVYRWAEGKGYPARDEHIVVEGLPTQLVPAPDALAMEAIAAAADLEYEGIPVRVVRPEYLIALTLVPGAGSHKRRERAAALLDLPSLNRALLDEILDRHGLAF